MWGSLRLIQQHGAWHYCQECIQIRDVSTKVDAPKGSYECLHMVTILHIEIMRWMCYECHLCMALAWSDLNHYAQFYCLWAACPCLSWFVVAQIKSKLPSTLQLESSSLWVSFMLTLHSGIVYGCKQAYTHACTMQCGAHSGSPQWHSRYWCFCLFRHKTALPKVSQMKALQCEMTVF